MELIETIGNRRSIRKFKHTSIEKEMIEDLINCARLAPSAKNRQPWKFLILETNIKNQVADIMIEEENSKLYSKINSSVLATAETIKQAPILILVLTQDDKNWTIGDSLSIGAAIEHICLRATDLGLGSLWIRDIIYTKKEIAKLVNHEDMDVIAAISIGYPDEFPKQRPRKQLDDILEWI